MTAARSLPATLPFGKAPIAVGAWIDGSSQLMTNPYPRQAQPAWNGRYRFGTGRRIHAALREITRKR